MNIEDLYPYLLPEVPDCPDETLRHAVVLTAIDFCKETQAWNEIADAVTLVDGTADYDIDYPTGSVAATVLGVWCDGKEMRPATQSVLDDNMPDWRTATSNRPIYYNAPADWGSIRVYPTPAESRGATLTLRGVFIPKLSATALPNFMAEQFLDCLLAGTKSRLMLQPRQKWTDAQLAMAHKQTYLELRADARITVLSERVPGITRVRPVAFGG